MPVSPEQCREARALLQWPRVRLAARADVPEAAVQWLELGKDVPAAWQGQIQTTFEAAGVEFTNNGALGVKLKKGNAIGQPAVVSDIPTYRYTDNPRG